MKFFLANRLTLCIFYVIFLINSSETVELECKFQTVFVGDSPYYSCIAVNFRIPKPEDRIISNINGTYDFLGQALNRKEIVERLFFDKQFSPRIPLGIDKFFEKLRILYIKDSNVQVLQKGDFEGLKFLKTLDLSHNPIDFLTADVFEGVESIERLVFWGCHLRFIDPKALVPLVMLREALFDENVCIDARCERDNGCVENLAIEFENKCRDDANLSCYKKSTKREIVKEEEETNFIEQNIYIIFTTFLALIFLQAGFLSRILRSKNDIQRNGLEFVNLASES